MPNWYVKVEEKPVLKSINTDSETKWQFRMGDLKMNVTVTPPEKFQYVDLDDYKKSVQEEYKEIVKPDYEQLCKEYEYKIDELNRKNSELQEAVKARDYCLEYKEKEVARLEGRIAGLEFAIRCNGVSGGEVTK